MWADGTLGWNRYISDRLSLERFLSFGGRTSWVVVFDSLILNDVPDHRRQRVKSPIQSQRGAIPFFFPGCESMCIGSPTVARAKLKGFPHMLQSSSSCFFVKCLNKDSSMSGSCIGSSLNCSVLHVHTALFVLIHVCEQVVCR